MTTAELNAQVDNNPTVQQAAKAVEASRAKLNEAIAAKDAAYNYWQEKKGDYERLGKLTPPLLKNQKRLLMEKAQSDYNTKVSNHATAVAEYNSTLAVYEQVRKKVNDTIVEQAKAASAAEIEKSKADAAKSNTGTSANITKSVQAAKELETEKAKRQKFILIGGIMLVVIVIAGIFIYNKYKK